MKFRENCPIFAWFSHFRKYWKCIFVSTLIQMLANWSYFLRWGGVFECLVGCWEALQTNLVMFNISGSEAVEVAAGFWALCYYDTRPPAHLQYTKHLTAPVATKSPLKLHLNINYPWITPEVTSKYKFLLYLLVLTVKQNCGPRKSDRGSFKGTPTRSKCFK
jgi:hypothetical protein